MRTVVVVLATAGAVGCTPDVTVARHTVAEYRANAALRREIFAQCLNDPGTLGQTADCINAREAERQAAQRSLRDQPSLGLRPQGSR